MLRLLPPRDRASQGGDGQHWAPGLCPCPAGRQHPRIWVRSRTVASCPPLAVAKPPASTGIAIIAIHEGPWMGQSEGSAGREKSNAD